MLQIVTTHDLVVGDEEVNLENHSRCLLGNTRDLKEIHENSSFAKSVLGPLIGWRKNIFSHLY